MLMSFEEKRGDLMDAPIPLLKQILIPAVPRKSEGISRSVSHSFSRLLRQVHSSMELAPF